MKIIQTIYIKYALEFNVFWILNFLAECGPDWSVLYSRVLFELSN